ncbi:helix-turn-helix domain-containing protein [Kordia sp.]|uniref:helix-turn-helix domain-containing protein n=1 Tax=Kordia sp. TaxID=1965332 RepID=UPI003D6A2B44
MIIKEFLPKTELLKKGVHSYYFIYGDKKKYSCIAFPNTMKSILIGINTRLNYTNDTIDTKTDIDTVSIQILNNTRANKFIINQSDIILQINFLSTGLCRFMNAPISVLDYPKNDELIHRLKNILLHNNQTEEGILNTIECILVAVYKEQKIEQLQRALQLLETSNSIKKVANEVNMSYRTLHRHFKKYTGLTPSIYQRIFRLREALLSNENHLNIFYDESHFIREFKFFTGYTPSKYKKKLKKQMVDFYFQVQ